MDPNLHFRTAIPGWMGFLAASLVIWGNGRSWFSLLNVPTSRCNDAAALAGALAVAFLGAPAAGYLANTLVIAATELSKRGPAHSRLFDSFKNKVLDSIPGTCSAHMSLRRAIEASSGGALVAHFEYRVDTGILLEWRRRQRAAFFANWANVVAILCGTIISALLVHGRLGWTQGRFWWILGGIVCNLGLALAMAYVAAVSLRTSDGQQRIWADSLTRNDIRAFLRGKGKGLSDGTGEGRT
jgi:hypothetical protein